VLHYTNLSLFFSQDKTDINVERVKSTVMLGYGYATLYGPPRYSNYIHSIYTLCGPPRYSNYIHSIYTLYGPPRYSNYIHSIYTLYGPPRYSNYIHSTYNCTSMRRFLGISQITEKLFSYSTKMLCFISFSLTEENMDSHWRKMF